MAFEHGNGNIYGEQAGERNVGDNKNQIPTSKILCGSDKDNADNVNVSKILIQEAFRAINSINLISAEPDYAYQSSIYPISNNLTGGKTTVENWGPTKVDNLTDLQNYQYTLQAKVSPQNIVLSCVKYCLKLRLPTDRCLSLDMNDSLLLAKILEINRLRDLNNLQKCARDYNSTCEVTFVHTLFVGYLFPALLAICVIGNLLNLLVYVGRDMRKSNTVKMLMAKAILNILFMICLLPYSLLQLSDGRNSLVDERLVWTIRPYFTFMSNVTGFCAAWLTVMMTVERYLFIVYPLRSRKWCTTRNFSVCFGVIFIAAILIYIEIPFVREHKSSECPPLDRLVHREYITNSDNWDSELWEKIYNVLSVTLYVLIPAIILAYCGIRSAYELICKSLPTHSDTKQCVTRITLATTCCHLTLECPIIFLFFIALISGTGAINSNYSLCVTYVLINFAVQLNASVCFIIYMSCSARFRSLLFARLKLCLHYGEMKSPYGVQNGSSATNGGNTKNRRPGTLNGTRNGHRQSEHMLMVNNNSTTFNHSQTPDKEFDDYTNAATTFL